MEQEKNLHRSTSRVLEILQLVAEHPSAYTMTNICQITNAPKSSLFPILHTLVAYHFLSVDEGGHYKIDYSAFQVGLSYLDKIDFMDEVKNVLTVLTNSCMETSHFAILTEKYVTYLAKIDSPELINMTSRVGIQLPAYGTSLGKALLMDHSLEEIRRLYPEGLPPLTEHTITDVDTLYAQLLEARETGYTYEIEESTQYIRCYAVPLHKDGKVIAAISVAIPIFRFSEEKGAHTRKLLFEAQAKLDSILDKINANFLITEEKR